MNESTQQLVMKANPNWRGGKVKHLGYWKYSGFKARKSADSNGLMFEHRLIAEDYLLKRILKAAEIVHHINGNKLDNRPENLIVCSSKKEHNAIHGQLKSLLPQLVDLGVVGFDKEKKEYFIIDPKKYRK